MSEGTLPPGNPEQRGHRKLQPRLAHPAARLDHPLRRTPLANIGQNTGVTALHTEIDDPEPQTFQFGQLLRTFPQNALGVSIKSHPRDPRHGRSNLFQQCRQLRLRQDQNITVRQEHPPQERQVFGGVPDVRIDNGLVLETKTLAFVRTAKGAFIVGTSHRHLDENALRLAGRPNDVPFVMHTVHDSNPTSKMRF